MRALGRSVVIAMSGVALCLLVSSCGGTSAKELAQKLDDACEANIAVAIWLAEHAQKEHLDVAASEKIAARSGKRFQRTLADLEPPSSRAKDLRRLRAVIDGPQPTSMDQFRGRLAKLAGLYRQLGADGCRRVAEANLKMTNGLSTEQAFEKVGLKLPARPESW